MRQHRQDLEYYNWKGCRVNGIAVQAKVFGPHLSRAELPHIGKKKQISISIDQRDMDVYVAGARVGPQRFPTNILMLWNLRKLLRVPATTKNGVRIRSLSLSQVGLDLTS